MVPLAAVRGGRIHRRRSLGGGRCPRRRSATNAIESPRSLDRSEALDVVGRIGFGRLAFAIGGEPDIVPVSLAVDEGRIYFRTAEGTKLFGLTVNPRVALEVDSVDTAAGVATSVVGHGSARELVGQDEIAHAESLELRSWTPAARQHFVEVVLDDITGREFSSETARADG